MLHGRQGGRLSRKFGLDWPQIDRFTKTQGRGDPIVKLDEGYGKGNNYVCGVGVDDHKERWETTGVHLEALEDTAALIR